jgi:hypothetical protein
MLYPIKSLFEVELDNDKGLFRNFADVKILKCPGKTIMD